ncbi:MAG: hypothetical protein ACTFAK_16105 [Candidatus Electronema sp. VV]
MTADDAGVKPAAPKKTAASESRRQPVPGRRCGQTAVTAFLLAVFSLAVLCVGIGLTWLAPPR